MVPFSHVYNYKECKFDTLCDLYDSLTIKQSVIFCNTRKIVDWLANKLKESHFSVCAMHGDMSKRDRENVMDEFRALEDYCISYNRKYKVIASTDDYYQRIAIKFEN